MTRDEAERLSILFMQIVGLLDQSVAFVGDKDDEANEQRHRRAVGKVMGRIFMDIEEPLWNRFPELRPQEMGGPYKVDLAIYEPLFYEDYGSEAND